MSREFTKHEAFRFDNTVANAADKYREINRQTAIAKSQDLTATLLALILEEL